MSRSDRRREEKERLWNEVMKRKRAYEKSDEEREGELFMNDKEQSTLETLKSADQAMEELNEILRKQQKELESLSHETNKRNQIDPSLMDMNRLEADLKKDFGVSESLTEEKKPQAKTDFDSAAVFDEIYQLADLRVIGQSEALKQLVVGFRRPYVMGVEEGKPRNVILVCGPRGAGKHKAIREIARLL